MKFQELVVLLPCHSLEDFPTYYQGDDAEGLLAAWCALWHPALVASAQSLPAWYRADDPPAPSSDRLYIIPPVSRRELPAGWADGAAAQGAVVLADLHRRDDLLSAALSALDGGDAGIDRALTADFLALGYCYLQVELLTRRMRYTSHIDQVHFENETTAAAAAAARGDSQAARDHLRSGFDILAQARDQFYPVDSYLIDLILVASTTIGPALRDELAGDTPTNLLISAEVLEEMSRREPETLRALRGALERGTASIVGGEYSERELPLLPPETMLAEFEHGRRVYWELLGQVPKIYGRRRFGLTPTLPQTLVKLGFVAAIHATLDGGLFPGGHQAKTRWEGYDGTAIDILARPPRDASRADTFVNLSQLIGDAMDMDHVATICLARWPGMASVWHHDLVRIARSGPTLGRFVTLENYFSTTDTPDMLSRFEADQYQSPYLRQAVDQQEKNPISRHVRAHTERAKTDAAQAAAFMADLIQGTGSPDTSAPRPIEKTLAALAQGAAGEKASGRSGWLIVNPASYARRLNLELDHLAAPPYVADHVRAAAARDHHSQVVVDVPAMGFAWVGPSDKPAATRAAAVPLAEGNVLRNEHMEVIVNPTSGAIQALHVYNRRGNQLSQQIAHRGTTYSLMAADSVEVTASTEAMGRIVSRGRLLDHHGHPLARFEQTLELWRGSRVLPIRIKLTPDVEPGGDPWKSYFAVRFAWHDPSALLWRSVGLGSHPTLVRRIEAPHFVEIHRDGHRLTIFTGGLPFHQQSGERMLDTLLVVRGETAREFHLAVGVDLTHPLPAALDLVAGDAELAVRADCPASGPAGWLFHLDAKNVVATHWEPLWTGTELRGFRVRLMESEGRPGRARLTPFRPVQSAVETDLLGQIQCDLPIEDGKIMIDFAAYQWVQVEAEWKR